MYTSAVWGPRQRVADGVIAGRFCEENEPARKGLRSSKESPTSGESLWYTLSNCVVMASEWCEREGAGEGEKMGGTSGAAVRASHATGTRCGV